MPEDPPRSRPARQAAEAALIRVVHNYGAIPEFVVLGGLVPPILCSASKLLHAGTIDIDVQVNMEIAAGAVNAVRLERALLDAEFEPEGKDIWRWRAESEMPPMTIKFELLADLDDARAQSIVGFSGCRALGAANLRGTGFAARDRMLHRLRSSIGGVEHRAEVSVAGTAGFLLAKTAAAHQRRKEKDWYDIAFVLLHNDAGGPEEAATLVRRRFEDSLHGEILTALHDLRANFGTPSAQGPTAYASQMQLDHPTLADAELRADAVLAVGAFYDRLLAP